MGYTRLAFSKHGESENAKTAVVILHGLFGSFRNWRTISEGLAQRLSRPVYAVDLRNHGSTFTTTGVQPMTWQLLSEDLGCFLSNLKQSRVTVVGHSLGGQVIMQGLLLGCRALHERVNSCVVVDVAPKPMRFAGSHISGLLDKMIELEHSKLKSRLEAYKFLNQIEPSDAVIQFLLSNGSINKGIFKFNIPLVALRDGMLNLQNTYNSFEKIPSVSIPLLFIRGGMSDFIKVPEDEAIIKAQFPISKLVTINNAGHWPHYEQPNQVIELISNFLSDPPSI